MRYAFTAARVRPPRGLPSILRTIRRAIVFAVVPGLLVVVPAGPAAAFTDVPPSHWAVNQIVHVSILHPWMLDYGPDKFRPDEFEARKFWARALVLAFAPAERIDPRITFRDISKNSYWYRFANVATKLGWMSKQPSGKWAPDGRIRVGRFDRSLVSALGVPGAVEGLARIRQTDGRRFPVDPNFPYLQIARTLGLHFNHTNESLDIQASSFITRDEAAYSLWKAKTLSAWQRDRTDRFERVVLGTAHANTRKMIEYALNQVGKRPYIYGGEWNAESPSGYCCGYQPQGGMDCSGFVWWVVKRAESGYNAARFRRYAGWSLPQRSSREMARYTKSPMAYTALRVGDLMFFASNSGRQWDDVDHVGLYAGNGWMVHTASSNDGAVVEWVGDGYYRDHFVFGRRVIGPHANGPTLVTEDLRTAGDRGLEWPSPAPGPPGGLLRSEIG